MHRSQTNRRRRSPSSPHPQLGLYGVVSYMVARRVNEIGIRIALGADRQTVVRLIMREAALLLSAGLVVGSVLVLAVTRAARSVLFGLKPNDPVTLLCGITGLAAVALLASLLPALRAARLDPTRVLREE